jgi:hypothetical protein
MSNGVTLEIPVHFALERRGRRRLRLGEPEAPPPVEPGNIPRISRLMALAIRFERLIREGHVRDYADLARLGGVTRARITQIMSLLSLAPEIQEELLFLPKTVQGRDRYCLREMLRFLPILDWDEQRRQWRKL